MGVSAYPAVELPAGLLAPYAGATAPAGWLLCDGAAVSRAAYPGLFATIGTTYGAGDGTSTFNVPDLRGRTVVGAGQGAGLTNRVRGATLGAETVALATAEMPAHSHAGATGGQSVTHTHSGTSSSVSVDHAHNVYARDQWTGWPDANHTHTFGASNANGAGGNVGLSPGGSSYALGYIGGAGTGTVSAWHGHNFNHDHPSTNFATQSPWAGNTGSHNHTLTTGNASVSHTHTVSSEGGGGAHENMPPGLVANYLIKT